MTAGERDQTSAALTDPTRRTILLRLTLYGHAWHGSFDQLEVVLAELQDAGAREGT